MTGPTPRVPGQLGPAPLRPRSRLERDAADRELIRRAREERSPEARRQAVDAFLPLVRSLARRYRRGEEPLEDLEQVAAIGLLKAIEGFDLERGTAFSSFAVPTIVGELRRHFRDKGWTIRVPRDLQELSLRVSRVQEMMTAEAGRPPTIAELAERLDAPVERVLEAREAVHAMRPTSLDRPVLVDGGSSGEGDATLADQVGTEEPGFARAEAAATANDLLSRLEPRERRIVELRFREELTQSEIGERVGCSQMQVSRLLRRALAELGELAEAQTVGG
jgi:RNA polymerase sigma-B factor